MRLVTLELTIRLLTQIVMHSNASFLQDCHLAAIEGAKEESSSVLRNFYKVLQNTIFLMSEFCLKSKLTIISKLLFHSE